ncbi:MAG: hypothetical protein L3J39_00655 [Verrucomicrobiales bacterium]|nr:hypothetical protein [Verrucomicrobiales bacterium]
MLSIRLNLAGAFVCFWLGTSGLLAEQDQIPAPAVSNVTQTKQDGVQSGGQYIRYVEKGKTAQLQTAIAHFVRDRDGATVDLIAVVHIGDQAYYDDLDNRMITYEGVLYEMVGGPYNQKVEESAPAQGTPLAALTMLHGMMQTLLQLEYQKDGIDYLRGNFIHADVDWEKFQALSEQRNQTLVTWFERAIALANSEQIPGIPNNEEESQEMLTALLTAVINGDAATIKRVLAPILSEAETLITRLEGEQGTIIVTERNKIAFEVLHEQLRFGKRKLAVLYGAGHMPDLEKRLQKLGFHKTNTEWKTAWDIHDVPTGLSKNILGDLLQDKKIKGLLNSAMKLIDEITKLPKGAEGGKTE